MFFPKLIVTDLDGTALKNDKTISDRTIQAFSRCEQMGIPVAIATARYIYGARPYAEALHARYQILTDGTLIYEHEKCIYSNCMDLHTTVIQKIHRSHMIIFSFHRRNLSLIRQIKW